MSAAIMITACIPPDPESEDSRLPRLPAPPQNREAQEEVGEQGDRAHEHPDHQREPDVEVANVAQLVGHDALELLAVQLLQQAGGDGHRCVPGIAPRRERVGGGVVDEVHPGHRQAGRHRQLLDDVPQLRHLLGGHLARPGRREHERVTHVVAGERRDEAHPDRDGHRRQGGARVARHGPPDEQPEQAEEQHDSQGEQDGVPLVRPDLAVEGRCHRYQAGARRTLFS